MDAYYINLDRDEDRRLRFQRHLAEVGLSATRISGVTPLDLPADLIAKCCDPSLLDHVTPPELACTMSHRKAWQQMLDRGQDFALFLEDDVMLSPALKGFLHSAPAVLERYGLIHVEANRKQITVGPKLTSIGAIGLHRPYSYNYGSGGYILTARIARRLLARAQPWTACIDDVLFNPDEASFRELQPVQTVPALIANGGVLAMLAGGRHPSNLLEFRRLRNDRRAEILDARRAASVWNNPLLRRVGNAWDRGTDALQGVIDRRIRRVRKVKMQLAGVETPRG